MIFHERTGGQEKGGGRSERCLRTGNEEGNKEKKEHRGCNRPKGESGLDAGGKG